MDRFISLSVTVLVLYCDNQVNLKLLLMSSWPLPSMYDCVDVTGVVKCLERSVDWHYRIASPFTNCQCVYCIDWIEGGTLF